MNILKKIAQKLLKTDFAQKALKEHADLSAFKQHPGVTAATGIFLIIVSYIIGWPAIALLGYLSIYWNEPLLIIIGGPVTYGLSHVIFLIGMYLAGSKYSMIFLKWATRIFIEKIIGKQEDL